MTTRATITSRIGVASGESRSRGCGARPRGHLRGVRRRSKDPASPDNDPAVWEYYRKILRLRKDSPELARGELLFDKIVCDDPHVMSFIRRLNGRASLVLGNFSGEARRPRLSLHLPGHVLDAARLVNPQSGAEVSAVTEGDGVRFQLAPYEVLVGRLDTQPSAN
ncbi:MAG: hypothetical protein WD060_01250 [Pirellulales bacterium]